VKSNALGALRSSRSRHVAPSDKGLRRSAPGAGQSYKGWLKGIGAVWQLTAVDIATRFTVVR